MTDKESIVMKTLFNYALQEYSRLNLTEEKKDLEGLPDFNPPKETYRLEIKIQKDIQERCKKTNITITARAIIPSEECLEMVEAINEVFRLRTEDGYCATTGSNRIMLKEATWFSLGNYWLGTCNEKAMNIGQFGDHEHNILLSPIGQGEAKVACGKQSFYITTSNNSYYQIQPACSATFRSVNNR